jgi:flagellar biogenesis protein FliO
MRHKPFWLLLLSFLSAEGVTINYTPAALNSTYASMMMYILKLSILLAIIMAVYFWWRRGLLIGGGKFEPNLKVMERLALDAKTSVYLLEMRGKYFLLSSGERPVQVLDTFGKDKPKLELIERKNFESILAEKLKGRKNASKN